MDREFLERIDAHMGRGNEIMDRVEAEMRLTREQHADHMRAMQEMHRGYRLSIRELMEVVRENREAMRENREAMRDMREEIRANTRAVLALLDRFENGGAGPATA